MNIFMRHIFWSTWNAKVIAQSPESQQEEMAAGLWLVAPGWWPMLRKKIGLSQWLKSIAIEFVPAKQVGMDVNAIIGDGMASRNSQSIELSSSDDPTWVADWMSSASRV